jgi:hypothetical protein
MRDPLPRNRRDPSRSLSLLAGRSRVPSFYSSSARQSASTGSSLSTPLATAISR